MVTCHILVTDSFHDKDGIPVTDRSITVRNGCILVTGRSIRVTSDRILVTEFAPGSPLAAVFWTADRVNRAPSVVVWPCHIQNDWRTTKRGKKRRQKHRTQVTNTELAAYGTSQRYITIRIRGYCLLVSRYWPILACHISGVWSGPILRTSVPD